MIGRVMSLSSEVLRHLIDLGSGFSHSEMGTCPPMLYVVSEHGDLVAYHFYMEKSRWPSVVRSISSKMSRDGIRPIGCFFICETYCLDYDHGDNDWYKRAALEWSSKHGSLRGSAFEHLLEEYLCAYTMIETGEAYVQKSLISLDASTDRRQFGGIISDRVDDFSGNIANTLLQLFLNGKPIDE